MCIQHLIRVSRFASLLGLVLLFGCAQYRVPAIDPTGERIFSGNTTTAGCQLPKLNPAWRDPATPPKCPGKSLVGPIGPTSPAFNAANVDPPSPVMMLSPQKMVAPVGQDVVVVAGLCGPKGHYVTRQPIQWMLAPESVGQIMEVGREKCHLAQLASSSPKKIDTTYATAQTSTISQTIDRGTVRKDDDMTLKKGESWVSVMSPQEGVSYVTAFAPHEDNWERRKNTATIYWVDARWSFPPPAIAKPADPYRLETHLVRTNSLPIAGWLVRYQILGGVPAALGAAGEQTVQVVTGADGFANVDLLPTARETGITQLLVQILRPDPNPSEQPLLVGQGYTHVQWSAPGLLVRGEATQATQADGAINYRVEVVNNGDQPSRDVILSYTPPAGVAVQASNPQAQAFGERLEWRLGDLPPRAGRAVAISARGNLGGEAQSCFNARSADGLQTPPVCFRTLVNVSGGAVQLRIRGPNNQNVTVGEQIQYGITIVNAGQTPLSGLMARATFDAGLQQFDNQPSPIEKPIGALPAGQALQEFFLTFTVRQAGTQCLQFDIAGDNNVSQTQRLCIRGVERMAQRPEMGSLRLRLTADPREAKEGDKAAFIVEASNTGREPLTNVRVTLSADGHLEPTAASEGREQTDKGISWVVAKLEPGAALTHQLDCNAIRAGEGLVDALATSDQTEPQREQAALVIHAAARPMAIDPPMLERPPVEPPRVDGKLKVTANALGNPIRLLADTDIVVRVTNEGDGADQNVSVRLTLPEGLSLKKVAGAPVKIAGVSPNKRIVDMEPVKELRGAESLPPFKFQITGDRTGQHKVLVEVMSASHPIAVAREVEIDVFGGN